MTIDSVQLFRLPAVDGVESSGVPVESIFVRMDSGDVFGFGEVCLPTGPTECEEWSAGAFACLRDWLAPALVGQAITSGERLQELLSPFQGNARAKSALDIAWWSLEAQRRQTPLHRLLGAERNTVAVSWTLGVAESPANLLNEIRKALDLGVREVTLKYRPGWELEMVRAVRQEFPAEPIAIDCDGLCTLSQQEMFFRLEDFNLKYIEQPLAADDLVGHAMLQSSLRTPIMLDQSITSLPRAEQAIDLGGCQRARIDIARVGGITPAVAIRNVCRATNVPCGVGGGPSSEVAASAAAALAATCDLPLVSEAYGWRAHDWNRSDDTMLKASSPSGAYEITLLDDAPGFGFLPDPEFFTAGSTERATIG